MDFYPGSSDYADSGGKVAVNGRHSRSMGNLRVEHNKVEAKSADSKIPFVRLIETGQRA